jgi:hypothetical protein
MKSAPTVQSAGFLLGRHSTFVSSDGEERVRCASLLKPLLFWAASAISPFAEDHARWEQLARVAVTVSDNAATVEVWDACGAAFLLEELAARTGIEFAVEPGGKRAFGRVLVNANEVARAYAALSQHRGWAGERLLEWMRAVPDEQTFGVRAVLARELDVAAAEVGVKCGWFCDEDEERIRTHAATVVFAGNVVVGTAVVTALPIAEEDRSAYAVADGHDEEELAIHERIAGETVREETRKVLAKLVG